MQSIPRWWPGEAARVARDLEKDLAHLRRRGIDPATFLGGRLVHMTRRVESISTI